MTSSYEQRIVDAILRHSEALDRSDDNAAADALCEALTSAKHLREQRRDSSEPPHVYGDPDRELHAMRVKVHDALFEVDGVTMPAATRALIEQHLAHATAAATKAVRLARKEPQKQGGRP